MQPRFPSANYRFLCQPRVGFDDLDFPKPPQPPSSGLVKRLLSRDGAERVSVYDHLAYLHKRSQIEKKREEVLCQIDCALAWRYGGHAERSTAFDAYLTRELSSRVCKFLEPNPSSSHPSLSRETADEFNKEVQAVSQAVRAIERASSLEGMVCRKLEQPCALSLGAAWGYGYFLMKEKLEPGGDAGAASGREGKSSPAGARDADSATWAKAMAAFHEACKQCVNAENKLMSDKVPQLVDQAIASAKAQAGVREGEPGSPAAKG